ncbi:acetyltransferase [Paenibacillus sambharensis]|uniref:Acetyltransferase n=1 Tax=Paenibacillus sambharensis TaxID=1803190 RepID=A0A2W1LRY2_9BACL|nr:DapH/DapD/GlmU-related protein [Paenibacillus sambharensis]PZD97732.1 acetyltransferase [Paenibacillus sambharensis]
MSVQRQVNFGTVAALAKGVMLFKPRSTSVGRLIRVKGKLYLRNKGSLVVGRNVSFRTLHTPSSIDVGRHAELTIGDNCFFNYGLDIGCAKSIMIGSNTIIGPMVNIMDSNWHPVDMDSGNESRAVVIEENVWIGRGVLVLPGVRIGRNSVIAAGSIVNKDIPDNVLAAGVPAKVIRQLRVEDTWIRRDH